MTADMFFRRCLGIMALAFARCLGRGFLNKAGRCWNRPDGAFGLRPSIETRRFVERVRTYYSRSFARKKERWPQACR
ncbi:MAG: hypothetical protein WCR24_03505 [Candidatus Methanomethylophilaceae archaeon]